MRIPVLVLLPLLALGSWGAQSLVARLTGGAAAAEALDLAGLPPGPGRDAVYYTCRACHSSRQFVQQRLSRDEWDALLTEMVKKNGMAEPEPWARTLMLAYLTTHFGPPDDEYGGLPTAPGQEETFGICGACHSIRLVTQQRLTRADWDETLVWMVEEQEMDPLEPEDRKLILDYLATYYGRDVPR
ncbi:MAG: hypothetical protein QNJ94_16230 [Alphaproteobacteria bacterium]|nr:hypothetical protein [Alphaproteobacteria bacterium]